MRSSILFAMILAVNLGKSVSGRGGCSEVEISISSGGPGGLDDFTFTAGENATINFSFKCNSSESDGSHGLLPWLIDLLSAHLRLKNKTTVVHLFSVYDLRHVEPEHRGKYDITMLNEQTPTGINVTVTIPNLDLSLNGSWIEIDERRKNFRPRSKRQLLVTCCTLRSLPSGYKPVGKCRDNTGRCAKNFSALCPGGVIHNGRSYIGSYNATCTVQSKWGFSDVLDERIPFFDFTDDDQVLVSGETVMFICLAENRYQAIMKIGNRTMSKKNKPVLVRMILQPNDNGVNATCSQVNKYGKTMKEKRTQLNVQFHPTLTKKFEDQHEFTRGESGHVIIEFQANPSLSRFSAMSLLKKGVQLSNFYLTSNQPSQPSSHQRVVIDFPKVSEEDFGDYLLQLPPLLVDFTLVERAATEISEKQQADTQSNLLAICLGAGLGVCVIGLITLAVLLGKSKASKPPPPEKMPEPGVMQPPPTPDVGGGLYCVPDFGRYENLNLPGVTASGQDDELYANTGM